MACFCIRRRLAGCARRDGRVDVAGEKEDGLWGATVVCAIDRRVRASGRPSPGRCTGPALASRWVTTEVTSELLRCMSALWPTAEKPFCRADLTDAGPHGSCVRSKGVRAHRHPREQRRCCEACLSTRRSTVRPAPCICAVHLIGLPVMRRMFGSVINIVSIWGQVSRNEVALLKRV